MSAYSILNAYTIIDLESKKPIIAADDWGLTVYVIGELPDLYTDKTDVENLLRDKKRFVGMAPVIATVKYSIELQ